MKKFVAFLVLSLSLAAHAGYNEYGQKEWYPKHPDPELTPGAYCGNRLPGDRTGRPVTCDRDVNGNEKWEVIERYNRKHGYEINRGNRMQFKIDHLVPLCYGGGNEKTNLWPQHESVYKLTDDLEHIGCEKLRGGRVSQKRVIELLLMAKKDHSKVKQVMGILQSL